MSYQETCWRCVAAAERGEARGCFDHNWAALDVKHEDKLKMQEMDPFLDVPEKFNMQAGGDINLEETYENKVLPLTTHHVVDIEPPSGYTDKDGFNVANYPSPHYPEPNYPKP